MTAIFDQERQAHTHAETPAEAPQQSWIQPVPDLVDPLGLIGSISGRWVGLPVNSVAFILQGMHPVIGEVLERYSVYQTDPLGRGIRSFDAVLQWFYGGKAAIEQGYWLRKMHQPLQMTDSHGKHISALNPEAYAWVVATAFASALWSAPLLVGRPYTPAEEETLFQEIRTTARCLQVPEQEFPQTRADFDRYLHRMTSEVLADTQPVRNIVHNFKSAPPRPSRVPAVLWLAAQPLVKFGLRVLSLFYIGVMPPEVRAIIKAEWSAKDERDLKLLGYLLRAAHRVLPERLTFAPMAYHARKLQRITNAMRKRELADFTAHDREARKAAGCPF